MAAPDPSTVRYPGPWQHRDIRANGIRFHIAEADTSASADPGRPDPSRPAPLVVLVHGFADLWWSWRHQLTALGAAGYHAVAVDLRGYGDSDKPPRGYDGWTLAGDISGLVRALGHSEADLVGHADGGLVCWATAALHPRAVRSISLLASPHPISLRRAAIRDSAQRAALLPSFLRYQVPLTPEKTLVADDGAEVERLVRARSSAQWQSSTEFGDVVSRMRSAVRIPGVAHSTLEYQRWAFRSQFRSDGRRFRAAIDRTVDLPALQILGSADPYVLPTTARRDSHWAPQLVEHRVTGSGHYVHQERPDEVTDVLLRHLRASGQPL
ncbi:MULTISPECIES: alpha/beta fold hydrolase [unclassified Rhodococcus (in: high G+C Gram-positive bacteria)]|uniref:alpha/beta fold hydrolase n=1 Tax=unclassified Rhodococcus (in: high G+C Gram-positive bacteria) TaxID=192944 RepID=UPI00048941EE|nr:MULTISPECIES: alpha/beta hydrolase [unclassified Rhodococcus (in: high G+C Gram-positive bacteria)]KQU28090.1 alpha/beta hydrolase [Rhodococcus sp. Leaf225]KQU46200.1 alpha/beta hydrolase [Rhodococcus sp. Leaf258]